MPPISIMIWPIVARAAAILDVSDCWLRSRDRSRHWFLGSVAVPRVSGFGHVPNVSTSRVLSLHVMWLLRSAHVRATRESASTIRADGTRHCCRCSALRRLAAGLGRLTARAAAAACRCHEWATFGNIRLRGLRAVCRSRCGSGTRGNNRPGAERRVHPSVEISDRFTRASARGGDRHRSSHQDIGSRSSCRRSTSSCARAASLAFAR